MTRINTNIESMRGLRNLQKSTSMQQTAMTRLSTGVKINSGKDSPSGLIASDRLRLQTTTIEQSIKNSNRANNVIATADSALGEIGSLLGQIRGLVQEGLNVGALSNEETEANQAQIDAALSAINRISSNTSFAGDKLLDGSKGFNTTTAASDVSKLTDVKVSEAIFGSSDNIAVSATVTDAASKAQLRYTGGAQTSAATLDIGGSKGRQTIYLGGASTLANTRDAINNVSDSTGVSARIVSGVTPSSAVVKNSVTTGLNGANNDLVFTDKRATSALGSNSSLGGSVGVRFVVGGASTALSVAVETDSTTNAKTITVNVATDANSAATSTATQVAAAIAANAEANALVGVANAGADTGAGVVTAMARTELYGGVDAGKSQYNAVASSLTTASAGNNNDLVYTDARATSALGRASSLGGTVSVQHAVAGNNTALSVEVLTDAATGNKTVKVNSATDANGVATSTAAQVKTAIEQHAEASGLVKVAVANGNDGSGAVAAVAATALTGGTDAGKLSFTDKRTAGALGKVNIVFADPGANNSALGIAVTQSGNDSTITVNLGTNASGVITSTLDNVRDAIAANAAASGLVDVLVSGDQDAKVGAMASTSLTEATGTLILESTEYGADQTVEVNVLNGSFATSDENGVVAARDTGSDIGVTINGQAAQGRGLSATLRTSQLDVTLSFSASGNKESESASVSINGGGALFQVGQEATAAGQLGVGIEAVNTARLGGISGKLYELGTGGGRSLMDIRAGLLGTGANVSQSDVVSIIDQAVNRVSTLRGRLGALQKNVIDTNVSTLGVALENISEARSQIVDTDFAEETANMQKAQVLAQAGISVLAMANQNPQQVLSLLR